MEKHSILSSRVKKLNLVIDTLNSEIKTSRIIQNKHKNAMEFIQSIDHYISKISESKEPAFNKTKKYIELKKKVQLKESIAKLKAKEKEEKLVELFTHPPTNNDYIDPSMLEDQEVKKILRVNKRSFGGYENPIIFPEIRPCYTTKHLLTTRFLGKKIIYDGKHKQKNICRENSLIAKIYGKAESITNQYSDRVYLEDKAIDKELKELVDECTLEFGQFKFRVGRSLVNKGRKF